MFLSRNRQRLSTSRRPTLEWLEGKQLLSVASLPGTVNSRTVGYQLDPDTATSDDGTTVVVWSDQTTRGDFDIRAQRYNSFGGKTGPEIVVASSIYDETQPSVAIDNYGRFVVSYTQVYQNNTNVLAQRFDPSGNKVGNPIAVSATTSQESDSDVAMDDRGDFVVAFDTSAYGVSHVYVKEFDGNSQLTKYINVSTSYANQVFPSVAMSPDGRFYVAWQEEYSTTDHDIYANGYSASGTLASAYTVSYSALNDLAPSISADDHGNAVVAWNQGGSIVARRLSPGWIGPQITIANYANNPYIRGNAVSVALDHQGGEFVAAYTVILTSSGGINYLDVAEVSAADGVTVVSAFSPNAYSPAVSIDAFGDYFVVDAELSSTGGTDIFGRRGQFTFNRTP